MASRADAVTPAPWWFRGSKNALCSAFIVVGVPVALGLMLVGKMRCSICLDALRLAVATDCGHTFCGRCLVQALRRRPRGRCPLCRRAVAAVTTLFSERERLAAPRSPLCRHKDAVSAFVAAYNGRRGHGTALLRELLTDISVALQRFLADLSLDPEQH
ncbi:E3 ubiquitin-protein ligase RNF170-like [Schistocerca cancellata]|uniref:E3 ubiquitin-protein ligase RNF170-like n=1 Tax=Schistocerca cancellata TaxID=274614 RepID=UPI002118A8CC|nr:E3 ubiquitin-protein ligase RNF170-like [Schistocerca cancellata]